MPEDSLIEQAKLKLEIHNFVTELISAFPEKTPSSIEISHKPPYFSITYSSSAPDDEWYRFIDHVAYRSAVKSINLELALAAYYDSELGIYTKMLTVAKDVDQRLLIENIISELRAARKALYIM